MPKIVGQVCRSSLTYFCTATHQGGGGRGGGRVTAETQAHAVLRSITWSLVTVSVFLRLIQMPSTFFALPHIPQGVLLKEKKTTLLVCEVNNNRIQIGNYRLHAL